MGFWSLDESETNSLLTARFLNLTPTTMGQTKLLITWRLIPRSRLASPHWQRALPLHLHCLPLSLALLTRVGSPEGGVRRGPRPGEPPTPHRVHPHSPQWVAPWVTVKLSCPQHHFGACVVWLALSTSLGPGMWDVVAGQSWTGSYWTENQPLMMFLNPHHQGQLPPNNPQVCLLLKKFISFFHHGLEPISAAPPEPEPPHSPPCNSVESDDPPGPLPNLGSFLKIELIFCSISLISTNSHSSLPLFLSHPPPPGSGFGPWDEEDTSTGEKDTPKRTRRRRSVTSISSQRLEELAKPWVLHALFPACHATPCSISLPLSRACIHANCIACLKPTAPTKPKKRKTKLVISYDI